MFSAESEKVKFGAANYRWKRPASGIINKLFKKYKTEAVTIIPYTFEDYQRKVKEEVLKSLTQEEIAQLRKRLKPEEVLTVSMKSKITMPEKTIAEFCRRNRIRRLSVFGSALRDDFGPDSDVDILVEFEPDTRVGLRFFGMEQELSEIIGRKVDLNTPGFLSPYFRKDILSEAESVYDAT